MPVEDLSYFHFWSNHTFKIVSFQFLFYSWCCLVSVEFCRVSTKCTSKKLPHLLTITTVLSIPRIATLLWRQYSICAAGLLSDLTGTEGTTQAQERESSRGGGHQKEANKPGKVGWRQLLPALRKLASLHFSLWFSPAQQPGKPNSVNDKGHWLWADGGKKSFLCSDAKNPSQTIALTRDA